MWADVAHEDDYVSDATDMRQIPGLGRTLVATRPIAAGTVLLSEFPLLMSVRELPRDTLQAVLDAETSAPCWQQSSSRRKRTPLVDDHP